MSYIIEIEQTNQDIDVVVSESTNDIDVTIDDTVTSYTVEVDSAAGITLGKEGADGDSAYDIAVAAGFVGTESEWLDSLVGATGATGDSAYDVWIAEGNVGNTSDFINAITGENGKDGLSAYEVWSQSNAGSESDYLNSLIGADGQQGLQGIQGVEGQEGASAYQVALMSGFSGTQQEWLDSLVGADGVDATPYDDTAIQAEVDANTAKVSNVDHPLVETAVPIGAVFTDTIYDDSDVLKDSDTVSSVTAGNKIITEIDVAALGGGDMLASTYDPIINANTAKVSNVDHPLVETAVPIGAVFTDTNTVYDDTAIQAEVDLNTAKISFDSTSSTRLANTSGTNTGDQTLPISGVDFDPVGTDNSDNNAVNSLYSGLQAEVDLNTAKVSNVDHPLVETAVPLGALFTDTDTIYNDTAIQAEVDANKVVVYSFAVGDEATDITTGVAKVTLRMPYAMTLTEVRASVTTAPVGSTIIMDVNLGGTSIFTTNLLSIDAAEKTSTTAATAANITTTALTDDGEITVDIDQIGSSTAGAGIKVYLIGTRV